ncbi:MAG TPA: methyltransferase domain-containing protein [Anaerolineae bacterium]|nr:methyltransferase domain-containing protein [Anaerolineae bacterium]
MKQFKFTTIGHQNHLFYSPISPTKANQLLALIPLQPNDIILDIGCGAGEWLIRLCALTGAVGRGLDINPDFIQLAQHRTQQHPHPLNIDWQTIPLNQLPPTNSYQALLCLGASHAFGTYHDALQQASQYLTPGGYLLIGDGFWQQLPHPDYLNILGASPNSYGTHVDNIQAGLDAGLTLLYATTSNQDEWDHYEGLYHHSLIHYAQNNPQDPDSATIHERITDWQKAYYQWGRATLGFGFYLFQTPLN